MWRGATGEIAVRGWRKKGQQDLGWRGAAGGIPPCSWDVGHDPKPSCPLPRSQGRLQALGACRWQQLTVLTLVGVSFPISVLPLSWCFIRPRLCFILLATHGPAYQEGMGRTSGRGIPEKKELYLPQTLRQNQNFPRSLQAALFSVSRAVNAATPLNSLQGKKKQLLDEGLLQKQHFLPFVLAVAVFGSWLFRLFIPHFQTLVHFQLGCMCASEIQWERWCAVTPSH